MSSKKKRAAASVIAVVLAATLALAGTFAWSGGDSSDGEEEGTKAPDVRLHDDNDKTNVTGLTNGEKYRKIYVENTGDVNLYVRVKLKEYMNKGGRTLIPGTVKVQKNTWKARYSDDGLEFSGTDIDRYVSLDTGENSTTKYIKGKKDNYSGGSDAVADEEATPSTPALDIGTTPSGQVMTMKEWNRLSTKPATGCWVLDTDGYAYWSEKLAEDEATCLLVNSLTINDIDESYYYGLSAYMEAVTESDVTAWIEGTKPSGASVAASQASKDAAALLKGLSSEYVKISSAMKATMPSADIYDNDGDGYLTRAQNSKYEKDVADVTASITAINGAIVDDPVNDVVTIDGVEWRVLSKAADGSQAELITKDMVTTIMYHTVALYPMWGKSDIRAYLNQDYYEGLSEGLKAMIKEETLDTPKAFNALSDLETTQDKVYLLNQGITAGALNNTIETPGKKILSQGAYQLKCAGTTLDGKSTNGHWWLRTPRGATNHAGSIDGGTGTITNDYVSHMYGVRPAITVRLK